MKNLTTEDLSLIETIFMSCLENKERQYGDLEYRAFDNLLKSVKETELLRKHHLLIETKFVELFNGISKIQSSQSDEIKFRAFIRLFKVSILIGVIEDFYIQFLDLIDTLAYFHKNRAFYRVINTESVSELVQKHYSTLLKGINKLPIKERERAFLKLNERANIR